MVVILGLSAAGSAILSVYSVLFSVVAVCFFVISGLHLAWPLELRRMLLIGWISRRSAQPAFAEDLFVRGGGFASCHPLLNSPALEYAGNARCFPGGA